RDDGDAVGRSARRGGVGVQAAVCCRLEATHLETSLSLIPKRPRFNLRTRDSLSGGYGVQRFHLTTSSCLRRRWEKTLDARSKSGSSAGCPTVTPVTIVRSSGSCSSSRQRASSSTGT